MHKHPTSHSAEENINKLKENKVFFQQKETNQNKKDRKKNKKNIVTGKISKAIASC